MSDVESFSMPRRITRTAHVGGVTVGGGAPKIIPIAIAGKALA